MGEGPPAKHSPQDFDLEGDDPGPGLARTARGEKFLTAWFIVGVAVPLAMETALTPTQAGLLAAVLVGAGNVVFWKARGESLREVYLERP